MFGSVIHYDCDLLYAGLFPAALSIVSTSCPQEERKKIRIEHCTMVTLTNPDDLFLNIFMRKITSDIIDCKIRHSYIKSPLTESM
jgi:hypothetical protein